MSAITLYIDNASDRDAVATILFRNGYTVRLGKVKVSGNRSKTFIEATEPDKVAGKEADAK